VASRICSARGHTCEREREQEEERTERAPLARRSQRLFVGRGLLSPALVVAIPLAFLLVEGLVVDARVGLGARLVLLFAHAA
jgi:hypothetical protein